MKGIVGICLILVSSLAMAQVTLYYSPEGVTYVESPPARYQLMEGIDVAITNVMKKGYNVTFQNVWAELNEMRIAKDIRFPYSYSYKAHGKKTKMFLTPENQRKKEEFEAIIKRRILAIAPKTKLLEAELSGPPKPADFAKRDDFINAYVAYKTKNIDEARKSNTEKRPED